MCRVKSENKRCECDTSEARQERRKNEAARNINALIAYQPTPDFSLPLIAREKPVTVDEIRAKIENLNEARDKLKPLLKSASRAGYGFFPEYDKILNNIGADIENLAETKYGAPTDNQLKSAMYPFTSHSYYKDVGKSLREGSNVSYSHLLAEQKLYSDFGSQIKETVGSLLEQRNEAYRNALKDSGVVFANPDSLQYAKESYDAAIKSVRNALHFYPQSWVDASNEEHLKGLPFVIKTTHERAEYNRSVTDFDDDWNTIEVARLTISKDSRFLVGDDPSMRVAIHEFAHRIQHTVKNLYMHERFFLDRRSGLGTASIERPTLIYPWDEEKEMQKEEHDRQVKEEGIRDNFPTHYMGKIQVGKATEILSMGMETLFAGTNGAFAGMLRTKADPDYKKFILGLLASSAAH